MMRGDKTVSSVYGDKTRPCVLGIGRWKGGCRSEGKLMVVNSKVRRYCLVETYRCTHIYTPTVQMPRIHKGWAAALGIKREWRE